MADGKTAPLLMGRDSFTRIRVSPFNVFFIVPAIALNRVSKTRYSWGISVLGCGSFVIHVTTHVLESEDTL